MILARNSITLHHLRDITTVVWYYKLQASTASPPAKPTTATPSGWSTTEPTYTEGSTNSLYTVQKTAFSDGTFEYSDVSLSSSYEAAKTAYNKSVQALDAVTPIDTKTYTGLIGSANNTPDATFYFAKIHPTNYTVQWNVSLRFHVTAPEAYAQDVTIRLGGYGSAFSSYDAYTVRTASVGMYYVSLYRATQAGISTNHKGHALGFSLKNATNPTNNSYKRTITVELLETENCTVDMLDTAVKYAQIDGTGSTNYSGTAPTEMGVATAGQNATNNSNTSYQQHGNAVKAGANGVRSYSLIMKDTDSTWSSLFGSAYNGTATGKTACTNGFHLGSILYSAGAPSGGNYAAGANTSTVYDGYPLDFRYSSNCASTLVSYKPVYLVGEMHDDGLFYLDETWWTQTVPTAEDGKTYVYVGEAYGSYQVWLSVENPAYQYYEGKFRKLSEVEEMKAAKVADNYLSSDNTGIMVADMNDGNQTPSTATGRNVFIDNDSVDIRNGQKVVASFGETSQIGESDKSHMFFDYHSLQLIDNEGNTYFHVSDLRNEQGKATLTETFLGDGTTTRFSISLADTSVVSVKINDIDTSAYTQSGVVFIFTTAPADGDEITIVYETIEMQAKAYTFGLRGTENIGALSVAEGNNTNASGFGSHAEGNETTARGRYSHAEGVRTIASGFGSHVEGERTIANESYSHAEGFITIANESYSHAEGFRTIASGLCSHSEGEDTAAAARASHAQNLGTIASKFGQTALGAWNEEDPYNTIYGKYIVIIGNGPDKNHRSNALAITWDGDTEFALDTTASSGTTDAGLYDAITALGWENDVIV